MEVHLVKIASLEYIELRPNAIKESWDSESIWSPIIPSFIVRLTSDDGTVGVGEATSQVWYLGETAAQISSTLDLYRKRLVGLDPTNLAAANQIMQMSYSGGMPGGRCAQSGVDMALHDLVGKLWGVPVSTLLGGARRKHLDLMTNLYHKTPEKMAAASAEFTARGFRGLKIKVGDTIWKNGLCAASIATDTSFLEAALDVIPNDVFVDADANQAWDNVGLTVSLLRRFTNFSNLSIEQPLKYDNADGHREVRQRSSVPVILDESVWSPEAAQNLIRAGACDRIVLKTNRVGGLSQAKNVIAVCEAAGIGVSIDTNPYTLVGDTAICHLGMTTRNHFPICCDGHETFLKLPDPSVFSGGVKTTNGYAELPELPGLGIEVDWEKLKSVAASQIGSR
jgi:L-alanine-DL-glutamate epimerase-like enolase superfamily enzyme